MQNSNKLGKARKKRRDRLSHLPEPIIYHILSYLDTESAVLTSVLSRAWLCAWKHVPVLDLSILSFGHYSSFVRFVDKVLSLRYPLGLRKLSFIDDHELMDQDEVDDRLYARVIKYAFSHDVQHFVIDIQHDMGIRDNYEFSHLFGSVTSSNVQTLELRSVSLDHNSQYSGFGFLTTLTLHYCWLPVPDVFSDSNFPCLRNLVIQECRAPHINKKGSISGLNLVSLELLPVPFVELEISAPKLQFLKICHCWRDLSKLSLPFLEHAEIGAGDHFGPRGEHLISLFQDLHNAKSLTLHSDIIQELSALSGVLEQQPSPFTRLKYLNLHSNNIPYKVVRYFLKGSSNTEPQIEFVTNGSRPLRRGF